MKKIIKKRIFFGILAIICIMVLLSSIAVSLYFQLSLENLREECETSIHIFLNSSDILTNEVFSYYDTKDIQHAYNYVNEAIITNTRAISEKRIKAYRLSTKEMLSLNHAIRISNSLSKIELRAIRLIAESTDVPESEMPAALAAYKLPIAESNLSKERKLEIAKNLLFGRQYLIQKIEIVKNVENFTYNLTNNISYKVERNIKTTWILIILFLLLFFASILKYQILYRKIEAEQQEELKQQAEGFRIVANQTKRFVFRYNLPTDTCYQISNYVNPYNTSPVMENFSTEIFTKNVVAKESCQAYKDFFESLQKNLLPTINDFKLIDKKKYYSLGSL